VVVRNLHLVRSIVLPQEADAELIVDSDAVLSHPVSFQSLESVSRWGAQIVKGDGRFDRIQFPECDGFNSFPPPVGARLEKLFRIAVSKALNHLSIMN